MGIQAIAAHGCTQFHTRGRIPVNHTDNYQFLGTLLTCVAAALVILSVPRIFSMFL